MGAELARSGFVAPILQKLREVTLEGKQNKSFVFVRRNLQLWLRMEKTEGEGQVGVTYGQGFGWVRVNVIVPC